jgi:hypothetical protein
MVCYCPTAKLSQTNGETFMKELPNFAAWSNKNLADFCTEAYIRMQEQQDAMEQLRQNWKDAMEITRELMLKDINDRA